MARPPFTSPVALEPGLSVDELGKKLGYAQQALQRGVSQGLSNGLTFKDNFCASVRELLVTVPDIAWVTPTLLNFWVAYDTAAYNTAQYRIDDRGRVFIRGLLKNGTAVAGTVMFTLPAGYRPYREIVFPTTSGGVLAEARVQIDGDVVISVGSNTSFSLDMLAFDAMAPCAAPMAFTGGEWPIAFDTQLPAAPQDIRVMRVTDITQSPAVTRSTTWGNAALQWQIEAGSKVKLLSSTGLSPGRTYRLLILSHAG